MDSCKVSVAPMMDWTDKHCRYFFRLLSAYTQLYTEMITSKAILRGDKNRLLDYNSSEHPLVLQLGGSDPKEMAQCAHIAKQWGDDEVNINVGCPSGRVLSGSFGACLMKEPDLVASCVESMIDASDIPVSVKSRIGIDDMESYNRLSDFVARIHKKGCQHFIIHARKAWLQGLSPKENRTIPPLKYPWVYQLKRDFPQLKITLNGGVTECNEVVKHLDHVDGVMRSEEHTSELQSRTNLVCRLLLEKKKQYILSLPPTPYLPDSFFSSLRFDYFRSALTIPSTLLLYLFL